MQRSPAEKIASPNDKSGTGTATATAAGTAVTPAPTKPKKFHNGWTRQLEILVAEWADKAACYRWMHEKTEAIYGRYNMYFTIPVIILSTLTGTANFGVDSLLPDPSYSKYASAIIGGVSILTGIISTVANFLRYAQGSEAHRVAGVSWGKFQRFISTELSLHPNERMDAMSFLKTARVELDRLIEQSPTIPQKVIAWFEREFKGISDIKRPENTKGGIEHTRFFDDRDARVARIAAEAAFFLQQKKGYMRKLIEDDFDKYIAERSKSEREQSEQVMLAELKQIARSAALEATETLVAKLPVSSRHATTAAASIATGTTNAAQRSPPKIPENTVQSTRKLFEAAPQQKGKIASLAAAVGAARAAAAQSPTHIRLEVIQESASPLPPPPPPQSTPAQTQSALKGNDAV